MKSYGLLLLLLFSYCMGEAQAFKQWSLGLYNESIAFPFTRFSPIHPGAEIGTTIWQKEKAHSTRQLNAYAGGYFHRKVETGIYLRGEYRHRFLLHQHIRLDLPIGLGYLHSFYPGELYRQDETTAEFEQITQTGQAHLLLQFGLGISFPNTSPIEPFIRQDLILQTPFYTGFSIGGHSFLQLGINLKLASHDNQ